MDILAAYDDALLQIREVLACRGDEHASETCARLWTILNRVGRYNRILDADRAATEVLAVVCITRDT